MTPSDFLQLQQTLNQKKKSKYNNKRITIDNHNFDSTAEGKHYGILQWRVKAGEITNLTLQPKFKIADEVMWNGVLLPAIFYKGDFSYNEKGNPNLVVEDKKGCKTRLYILKRQLFLLRYPNIDFREV